MRMVLCKKYNKEMEGLLTPPFPGSQGQDIFDNVSKQAWGEWQARQVRLINEKQLSMFNPEDRKYLTDQMEHFFANEDTDEADGYVPPEA
ncbi:MAG: oxidative damage protection protein [Gammaproteobacteria bacterium]|jgi:Fe-S cluster biosynthesis and repair protein YggX|nr:oxidative damage protection protein [Gammaproteobacteria bacterium]